MISVIIPTCNRNDQLKDCLAKLDPVVQVFNSDCYEVIVSDDSKTGMTKDMITQNFNWVQWIKGPGKGPAANRNTGAKEAKGEWLIFIDDDCLPDESLLNEYNKGIENNPDCLAFEGAIYPDNWELLKKDLAECPVNTKGGCFWSANICMYTNLFNQIGGFDEDYLIAAQEDQQLKLDIQKTMQSNIVFLKNAKVTHPVRFSSLRKRIIYIPVASKNFCLYAYKNKKVLGFTSLFNFFASQIFVHVKQSFTFLKTYRFKNFFVETVWLCFGVPLNVYNYFALHKKNNL